MGGFFAQAVGQMARRRDGTRTYRSGDPIHIVVTQDFEEDANRFFSYCRERGYNPSQVIRQAMKDWLEREEKGAVTLTADGENNNGNGSEVDELDRKLMTLIKDRRPTMTPRRGMSLKTVKELLEGS